MSCITFWKDKRNLNPITMKPHSEWTPPDEEEKKEINKRKKTKRNENNK